MNQDWVKGLQRRTKEYWEKRARKVAQKDSLFHEPTAKGTSAGLIKATLSSPSAETRVYEVPFASKNNTVQLSVENSTGIAVSNVRVGVTDTPPWLSFATRAIDLGGMGGSEQRTVTLAFSVDRSAPIGKEQVIILSVNVSTGEHWIKTIAVKVSPPEKFELFQNFPNPFNPTTTISYQLSQVSRVNLKIYNLLGQEIGTLVDGEQLAGYHQATFDATRLSSGMYIYRIVSTDASGRRSVAQKTMLALK